MKNIRMLVKVGERIDAGRCENAEEERKCAKLAEMRRRCGMYAEMRKISGDAEPCGDAELCGDAEEERKCGKCAEIWKT